MDYYKTLKNEFDGEEGSFILTLRCELQWDWSAFYRLTESMYFVATASAQKDQVNKQIANGFWFIDTWVKDYTMHENFPRPENEKYIEALELIHDLSYYFFFGESPYEDDTLLRLSKNEKIY